MLEEGWPTRAELAKRYAARSGRDLANLDWYAGLALWKLAVLYEYGRRRAALGVGDPYYADPALVRSFLEAAHRAVGLESTEET
jgi:aminoglycoside phosphotransferase (APT) family kinase protein